MVISLPDVFGYTRVWTIQAWVVAVAIAAVLFAVCLIFGGTRHCLRVAGGVVIAFCLGIWAEHWKRKHQRP